jgi:hypothetical protein
MRNEADYCPPSNLGTGCSWRTGVGIAGLRPYLGRTGICASRKGKKSLGFRNNNLEEAF